MHWGTRASVITSYSIHYTKLYELQDAKTREDALRTVREEIVALRRELRERGYDLSLGSTRLVIDGFRNDDSLAEGFRNNFV